MHRKSQAAFEWDRWRTLRGKRMAVFSYSIDSAHSSYTIDYNREQQIVTAYEGLVYADKDTGVISRLTFHAKNIPASFPVQDASNRLDYDNVEIAGRPYNLPLSASMRMKARERSPSGYVTTKNDIEFRMYRKFGSDITITFEPEPLPDDKTKEQPPSTEQAPK